MLSPQLARSSIDAALANALKGGRRQQRQYKCGRCHKAFKRNEHCIRHERTHTHERPYSCSFCEKSYARKDLLTRHLRTLHTNSVRQSPSNHGSSDANSPSSTISNSGTRAAEEHNVDERSAGMDAFVTQSHPPPAVSQALPRPIAGRNAFPEQAQTRADESVPSTLLSAAMGTDHQEDSILLRRESAVITSPQERPHSDIPVIDTREQRPRRLGSFTELPLDMAVPFDPCLDFHEATVQSHRRPEESATEHGTRQPQQLQTTAARQASMQGLFFDEDTTHAALTDQQMGLPSVEFSHNNTDAQLSYDCSFTPHRDGIFGISLDRFAMDVPMDWMAGPGPSSVGVDTRSPARETNMHSLGSDTNSVANSADSIPNIHGAVFHEQPGQLPLLMEEKRLTLPSLHMDRLLYQSLRDDLLRRLPLANLVKDLPSAKLCQGFLASYFECFHIHMPIIHLHTLSLNTAPSPLILTICSIGALYRLEHRRARRLYDLANQCINSEFVRVTLSHFGNFGSSLPHASQQSLPHSLTLSLISDDCSTNPTSHYPLWGVQAKLLLTFYATLSGESELVSSSLRQNGFYTLVYNRTRLAFAEDNFDLLSTTWEDWVHRESWKRLLCGIFIASTVIMVIYDVNPGFNYAQDLDIEMVNDESLWNAATAAEWRQLRTIHANRGRRTMKEVLADIIGSQMRPPRSEPYPVSAFSMLLIMHAIVVYTCQLSQISDAISGFSSAALLGQHGLGLTLLDQASRALGKCQELLRSDRSDAVVEGSYERMQTTLASNCQAVLRIAYTRLVSAASGFNRLSLLALETGAVELSATEFANAKPQKSPLMVKAVENCFEGFRTPVRMGYMLIRKTAAFRWGFEHAIAGWNCALFVTQWVHLVEVDALNNIELSVSERELMQSIRQVLEEADCELREDESVAAALARTWGNFLGDVWVWPVTPRMGEVLKQLGVAYERVYEANRRQ